MDEIAKMPCNDYLARATEDRAATQRTYRDELKAELERDTAWQNYQLAICAYAHKDWASVRHIMRPAYLLAI